MAQLITPAGRGMSVEAVPGETPSTRRRRELRASVDAARARAAQPMFDGDAGDREASLQRATSLVRRMRAMSASTAEAILAEAERLCLVHFTGEAADALAETAPVTTSDYLAVVAVAAAISARHPCLAAMLTARLCARLALCAPGTDAQTRALRLILELCAAGLCPEPSALSALSSVFPENAPDAAALPVATSVLCVFGAYLSVGDTLFSGAFVGGARRVVSRYLAVAADVARRARTRMGYLHGRARAQYNTRGASPAPWLVESLVAGHAEYVALVASLREAAVLCGLPPPGDLAEGEVERPVVVEGVLVYASAPCAVGPAFLDDEERAYFEDMLDVTAALPLSVLRRLGVDGAQTALGDDAALDSVAAIDPDAVVADAGGTDALDAFLASLAHATTLEAVDSAACEFASVVAFMCPAAEDGCAGRARDAVIADASQRLAVRLGALPWRRNEMLRPVARLAATLRPLFPAAASALCRSAFGQFLFLSRIDSPLAGTRSRVCRLIAELVRARAGHPSLALRALRRAVAEAFVGPNVDMAALILEHCGRWMLSQPDAAAPLTHIVEVLRRKRLAAPDLTYAQAAAVDNALAAIGPRADVALRPPRVRGERERFVRWLLRERLSADTARAVLRALLRLPWGRFSFPNGESVLQTLTQTLTESSTERLTETETLTETEPSTEIVVLKTLAKPWRMPGDALGAAAAVVVGLKNRDPALGPALCDALHDAALSALCDAVLVPDGPARATAAVAMFAHLYCYGAVPAGALLSLLWQVADAPACDARLRAVCTGLSVAAPCLCAEIRGLALFSEDGTARELESGNDMEFDSGDDSECGTHGRDNDSPLHQRESAVSGLPVEMSRRAIAAALEAVLTLVFARGHADGIDVEALFTLRDALAPYGLAPEDVSARLTHIRTRRAVLAAEPDIAATMARDLAAMVADGTRTQRPAFTAAPPSAVFFQPLPLSVRTGAAAAIARAAQRAQAEEAPTHVVLRRRADSRQLSAACCPVRISRP